MKSEVSSWMTNDNPDCVICYFVVFGVWRLAMTMGIADKERNTIGASKQAGFIVYM